MGFMCSLKIFFATRKKNKLYIYKSKWTGGFVVSFNGIFLEKTPTFSTTLLIFFGWGDYHHLTNKQLQVWQRLFQGVIFLDVLMLLVLSVASGPAFLSTIDQKGPQESPMIYVLQSFADFCFLVDFRKALIMLHTKTIHKRWTSTCFPTSGAILNFTLLDEEWPVEKETCGFDWETWGDFCCFHFFPMTLFILRNDIKIK